MARKGVPVTRHRQKCVFFTAFSSKNTNSSNSNLFFHDLKGRKVLTGILVFMQVLFFMTWLHQIPWVCHHVYISFSGHFSPVHKSKKVAALLKEYNVKTLDWPANSPDLNPIENMWSHLEKKGLFCRKLHEQGNIVWGPSKGVGCRPPRPAVTVVLVYPLENGHCPF